jgi:hypothetical protein
LRGVIFGPTQGTARTHTDASLPYVGGDDYIVEQPFACCPVLKIK